MAPPAGSIPLPAPGAFPGFLQGEVSAGRVVVETTAQVIGGQLNPACH